MSIHNTFSWRNIFKKISIPLDLEKDLIKTYVNLTVKNIFILVLMI